MRSTIVITTGWCGFGRTDGLFPEMRLGIVAIGWCRGSLREHVAALMMQQMARSNDAMRRMMARLRDAMKGDDA